MKRKFLITTIDNREFELPINLEVKNLGMKANHPGFIAEALKIASLGFCEDPKAANPRVVAPSQIRTVDIIFETNTEAKNGEMIIQP